MKPKTRKRKKTGQKSMKLETKIIEKINEIKSCFFEKMNKMDKSLTKLKKKREQIQITNIRNEGDALTTDHMDIKKHIAK